MLLSIALILLLGYIVGLIFEKIKIPKIVGMIIVGLIIGPYSLNILDDKILSISGELRQFALIIILIRAGLSLDLKVLKQIGRPALLLCFVPATFEIIATTIFAPLLLNISTIEALLLGAVLGAVSPAVIVPRMIKLSDEGYGIKNSIPQMILAGSSADDVYVIVLFYTFLGLVENNVFEFKNIALIPVSIILGILLGLIIALIYSKIIKRFKVSMIYQILIILSLSLLMVTLENVLTDIIPIASLLGVIIFGIVILSKNNSDALKLKEGFSNIWLFFEILLFVLVGATVNINYAMSSSFNIILLLILALIFRSVGVLLCLINTKLSFKEKIFSIISYLPKATVQASIGAIALQRDLEVGNLVLTIAVLSILITAPIGAFLIDNTYKKLLEKL